MSGNPTPGEVVQSPGLVTSRAMQSVVNVRSNVNMAERICILTVDTGFVGHVCINERLGEYVPLLTRFPRLQSPENRKK